MPAAKNILIIEDYKIVALDLKAQCEKLGHFTTYTDYSSNIFKKINSINPDLVIMNIVLDEGENIIDKTERICDQLNIPIIFFTTEPAFSYENHRLQNRCVFQKIPFKSEDLNNTIITLLKNYSDS